MREVTRVNNEIQWRTERVDLFDGGLRSGPDIRIRRFVLKLIRLSRI
jgi:hypothetical protein